MHLYTPSGEPCYEVENKSKGGMRNATLADARKLGLYPSVTEIGKVLAKPGLEAWKTEQMMLACLTTERKPNEPDKAFIARVRFDSKETGRIAMEEGQKIHDAVEKVFNGEKPHTHEVVAQRVYDEIVGTFGKDGWVAEESFACSMGYGGRIDLLNRELNIIIDLKTKEKLDPDKKTKDLVFDEHIMQLSAYSYGAGMINAKLLNVFVDWHGEVWMHEWTEEETIRGWDMFITCFKMWQLVKKYHPLGE